MEISLVMLRMHFIDAYYIVHPSATTTAKPEDEGETAKCLEYQRRKGIFIYKVAIISVN